MWPTWSDPEAVGGGVSMENTLSRVAVRSKVYTSVSAQVGPHTFSRPSTDGFSGIGRNVGDAVFSDIPHMVTDGWGVARTSFACRGQPREVLVVGTVTMGV